MHSRVQEDKVHGHITCANVLINACAEAGDMAAAVDVLEATVAAGAVPQSGTIAALLGGCQRVGAHELALQVPVPPCPVHQLRVPPCYGAGMWCGIRPFTHLSRVQVAKAGVARGIPTDGTTGFILLRVCFNKIRRLWTGSGGGGYPLPLPSSYDGGGAASNGAGKREQHRGGNDGDAEDCGDWPDRMMHAVTGRVGVAVREDGPDDPVAWRNRAHSIYRCASSATRSPSSQPIDIYSLLLPGRGWGRMHEAWGCVRRCQS